MKYLIIPSALILMLFSAFSGPKLVKKKINDKITISIPADFTVMNDEEIAQKYSSYRQPLAIFISENKEAELGVNLTANKWGDSDLNVMKDFYRATILSLHSNVKFTKDGTETINGRNFIVFEFDSEVAPDENAVNFQASVRKYNYIEYAFDGQRMTVFTFSCAEKVKSKWQELARHIMASVKIKDSKGEAPGKK